MVEIYFTKTSNTKQFLDCVLKKYGLNCADITIGAGGKPCIRGAEFNLSHSGGAAVIAVSKKPVGCDIEKIGAVRESVLQRFSPRELLSYAAFSEEERFYRLWTAKESYLKMTGEGISGIKKVEIIGDTVLYEGETMHCRIRQWKIEDYIVSACVQEKISDEVQIQ